MSANGFRKGVQVLHPQHGVGKVRSIRERSFSGHPSAKYVELYFERDDLTVSLLEQDLHATVRCLMTPGQASQLLSQIGAWNGRASPRWKTRANANQAAIDSGDPFENIKVLKSLARLERSGALRLCDKRHFNRSLGLLTDELVCALNKSPRQALSLINEAIGRKDPEELPVGA